MARRRSAASAARWLLLLLLMVVLVLAALVLAAGRGCGPAAWRGGAGPRPGGLPRCTAAQRSAHLVVDGLNATHAIFPGEPVTTASIVRMVDQLSPGLKAKHGGRVMFVVKDRDSEAAPAAAAEAYAEAARRNGVYLVSAERYRDAPMGGAHAARGRDDFTAALLADRWRCGLLTADRMKDFDQFRKTIAPYYTWTYSYWRALPEREFVDPRLPVYARVRRPCRIDYAAEDVGPMRPRAR